MKRFLLFLMMTLLLAGCTVKRPPETTLSTQPSTEPSGLYEPESRIEQETSGAVKVYPLETGGWTALYRMGNHLLLKKDGELMTLTGDSGIPEVSVSTGKETDISGISTTVTGIGYYLPDTREVVVCNPQLQTVNRLNMPENMAGEPVICMERNEVFYATETQIRAINLQTGISRLIRSQSAPGQMELQCHFGGEILVCRFTDAEGESHTEYLFSETGQSYMEEEGISELYSWQDRYWARYSDGVETQMIFGSKEGDAQVIELPQCANALVSGEVAALEWNGILSYSQTASVSKVSFFDLETGKQTAQVTLSGMELPGVFLCDETCIWFLAQDTEEDRQLLCRWDPEQSAVQDDAVYTRPLYTASHPDTEGILACRKRAENIESQYGITVAIWTEAQKYAEQYTVVPEYNTKRIEAMLTDLEYGLSLLPAELLYESVGDGRLMIALVRNVAERECAQYWKEGNCVLILPAENTLYAFFRTAAYAVDSYVLGNSRDLDSWEQFNPENFEYAYSYNFSENSPYLEGEERAFTEQLATSYPHEDRCSTFAYAMLPDNETVFETDVMQAKLRQLCLGIREAYRLEQSTETFPWEQYLKEPLAVEEE